MRSTKVVKVTDVNLPASALLPEALHILSRTQQCRITWQDAHESYYTFGYLRGFCPCAHCQGHGGALLFQTAAASASPLTLENVDEVGNYGLRLSWQPSHLTGIYTFAYLRQLCPCATCQAAQGATHLSQQLDATQRAQLLKPAAQSADSGASCGNTNG